MRISFDSPNKARIVLQAMVVLEIAVSVVTAWRSYTAIPFVAQGDRIITGWELSVWILKDMHIGRTLAALALMIIVLWAIHQKKRWAVPLVLILLVHAAFYLAWICFPWVWVYHDAFGKIMLVCEGVVLLLCFILLLPSKDSLDVERWDLASVGTAVVAALALIYIKGHYSFCCPQYGPEPPMWWVYFDISDLWDRPKETGLLIMWGCYAAMLGFRWCFRRAVRQTAA